MSKQYNIWWGPPKKFSTEFEERKISWLELFYDLVYVIVISRTTHLLAAFLGQYSILDYMYLFTIIFWGWYNGSQYYDLHGSPGIRTRFMTLWQIIAVAALAVTLDSPADKLIFRATISIAVLQGFIIYLWWSVGIYDKEHRRRNVPYTVCYLLALVLIIATLFVPQPYRRAIFWLTVILNYLPSFITMGRLRKKKQEFALSSSMVERLGLFTIIVFGESILGVINGMTGFVELSSSLWICFGLGILITVCLWWIFFSLIADREAKRGFGQSIVMALIYIPALASLGMVGACFPGMMKGFHANADWYIQLSRTLYGISLALFLCCITVISGFLVYPADYGKAKKMVRTLLVATGGVIVAITVLLKDISLNSYLLCVFVLLFLVIVIITNGWFRVQMRRLQDGKSEQGE